MIYSELPHPSFNLTYPGQLQPLPAKEGDLYCEASLMKTRIYIDGQWVDYKNSNNHLHQKMNLYLLKQEVNNDWDTYDSCIVAAANEQDAKEITPNGYFGCSWAKSIDDVQCLLIGTAIEGTEKGLVHSSFNAG